VATFGKKCPIFLYLTPLTAEVGLITTTETKPSPWLSLAGTGTTSWVVVMLEGVRGPSLTGPLAVATKKLTTEPLVKPRPLMVKLPPTSTGLLTPLMAGWPGSGVGVGTGTVGLGVLATQIGGVGVGVGFGVRVGGEV